MSAASSSDKLKETFVGTLPMLLLAGGAIIIVSKVLKSAGQTADGIAQALQLKKTDQQVQSEKQSSAAIARYVDEATKVQKPSRPDGFWAQLAERIYRDTRYSAPGDDHEDARFCMSYCNNDADFALLYKYYGRRQETFFGVFPDGDPKDLTMAIASNLSHSQKQQINSDYAKKKISIRFT